MDGIEAALASLESAITVYKADPDLTVEEALASGTMLTQIENCIKGWRIEAVKVKAITAEPVTE